jgi:hypothetical protein
MSIQKSTKMHYVDKAVYDETWKERLIYWGNRLREKLYQKTARIAELETELDAFRAKVTELEKKDTESADFICREDDNCPTENAVLQREWRQVTATVAQLEASRLVPGVMHCAKCNFSLTRINIYVGNGATGPGDNKTEPCPNGCGPLWPVTWEQEARDGWKINADLAVRNRELEASQVWIPVSERLPQDKEPVWWCCPEREVSRGWGDDYERRPYYEYWMHRQEAPQPPT